MVRATMDLSETAGIPCWSYEKSFFKFLNRIAHRLTSAVVETYEGNQSMYCGEVWQYGWYRGSAETEWPLYGNYRERLFSYHVFEC